MIKAKKSLGQNFLVDLNIIKKILDTVDIYNKSVLEIGRILIAQGKRDEAIKRFQDVLNVYGKEKAALVARQYIQEIRSN